MSPVSKDVSLTEQGCCMVVEFGYIWGEIVIFHSEMSQSKNIFVECQDSKLGTFLEGVYLYST